MDEAYSHRKPLPKYISYTCTVLEHIDMLSTGIW
jgi:hypothetical protein